MPKFVEFEVYNSLTDKQANKKISINTNFIEVVMKVDKKRTGIKTINKESVIVKGSYDYVMDIIRWTDLYELQIFLLTIVLNNKEA